MWFGIWSVGLAWSQAYEASPCAADAQLAAQLAAGEVAGIGPVGPSFRMVGATSLLPPSSSARPDLAAARRQATAKLMELGDEEAGLALVAADLLSCTYGPTNLADADPATAWCEGAKGPGIGEVVVIEVPPGKPLTIRNGYGKSPERFAQNGRIRRVEITLLGQGWTYPVTDVAAALPVLGRHEVELADTAEPQALPLPSWTTPASWAPTVAMNISVDPADQQPAFLALRILSTYPGSKWQDTCVSEISPAG